MMNDTMNNDVTLTGGENPLLAGRYQVVRQLGTGGACPSSPDGIRLSASLELAERVRLSEICNERVNTD